MTTENTSQPPPCPLPDCEGGEHHFHDVEAYAAEKDKTHDCATHARDGFRCYGPHRPGPSEPIDLPEITDEMVERATKTYVGASGYADPCMRTVLDQFRAELVAGVTRWQPIEHDQIRPGMRVKRTHKGVQMTLTVATRDATAVGTAEGWFLPLTTGTWHVDPATIPADPDAELIEKIGKAIYDADESGHVWANEWGEDGTEDAYRKLARAALDVVRESEVEA